MENQPVRKPMRPENVKLISQAVMAGLMTMVSLFTGFSASFIECWDRKWCYEDRIEFWLMIGLIGPTCLWIVTFILVKAFPMPDKAVVIIQVVAIVLTVVIPIVCGTVIEGAVGPSVYDNDY